MTQEIQPDWEAIAEKFDLWLPYIEPVGNMLIHKLDAQMGDKILDIASGTGEPALTLARKFNDSLTISGTDAAQGMVDVAQKKAKEQRLTNIHFSQMQAESLTFNTASFDKVMSRFGIMLFSNPEQGLREMYRVLKPGGICAFTVWSTPETMTTMKWVYNALKNKIPEDKYPPYKMATSLSQPGLLDNWLQNIGFQKITIENIGFNYCLDSFDDYWDLLIASDIIKMQLAILDEKSKAQVRDEICEFSQAYTTKKGLVIPHHYLLCYGKKE